MDKNTEQKLETAVAVAAHRAVCSTANAVETLQYTQAALNAAHALSELARLDDLKSMHSNGPRGGQMAP